MAEGFGVRLAERALAQPEGSLVRAALDITTGYGVDSFFWSPHPDPWALECVQRFADVLIQHDKVVYPTPDRQTLLPDELSQEDPQAFSFAKARKAPLLAPYADATAEDVQLQDHEIKALWSQFRIWAHGGDHHRSIREWLTLHRDTRVVKRRYAEAARTRLQRRIGDDISATQDYLSISRDDLLYLFDVFTRTVQYQRLLGSDTIFFPHPVRAAARVKSDVTFDGTTWSWGRFLASAMTADDKRDIDWFIDQIEQIRGAAARLGDNANWYDLARRSPREQAEVIKEIAAEAHLPARLTNKATREAMLFTTAAGAFTALATPLVGIALTLLGTLAAAKLGDEVPDSLAQFRIVRGYLDWPGLLR